MKIPINYWPLTLLTSLALLFFTNKEVQANNNEFEQLKARIEALEKELATLKRQQHKTAQENKKQITQNNADKILNNKQLLAVLQQWTKNNITNKQATAKKNKLPATDTKKLANQQQRNKKANRKNKNNNNKQRKQRKKRQLVKKPIVRRKPAIFPVAGKIKVNLQYNMAETTGRQLSVDGFSLLPIFVVGNIESQDIVSTSHNVNLSISRSLDNDSQVSLSIPYSYKTEERTNDSGQMTVQTRKKSQGLGDMRVTYNRQIFKENLKLPSLIGAVTWKTTTGKDPYDDPQALALGSGFNAIRAGVTAIKLDDPAVLFASTGYTINMEANKGSFGNIDPGDSYDLALGLTYSLTDRLSMNFGLEQVWTEKTRADNIANTDTVNSDRHTAALSVGAKLKSSAKRSINIRTKIGLNDSTPDFQLQIGVPLKN